MQPGQQHPGSQQEQLPSHSSSRCHGPQRVPDQPEAASERQSKQAAHPAWHALQRRRADAEGCSEVDVIEGTKTTQQRSVRQAGELPSPRSGSGAVSGFGLGSSCRTGARRKVFAQLGSCAAASGPAKISSSVSCTDSQVRRGTPRLPEAAATQRSGTYPAAGRPAGQELYHGQPPVPCRLANARLESRSFQCPRRRMQQRDIEPRVACGGNRSHRRAARPPRAKWEARLMPERPGVGAAFESRRQGRPRLVPELRPGPGAGSPPATWRPPTTARSTLPGIAAPHRWPRTPRSIQAPLERERRSPGWRSKKTVGPLLCFVFFPFSFPRAPRLLQGEACIRAQARAGKAALRRQHTPPRTKGAAAGYRPALAARRLTTAHTPAHAAVRAEQAGPAGTLVCTLGKSRKLRANAQAPKESKADHRARKAAAVTTVCVKDKVRSFPDYASPWRRAKPEVKDPLASKTTRGRPTRWAPAWLEGAARRSDAGQRVFLFSHAPLSSARNPQAPARGRLASRTSRTSPTAGKPRPPRHPRSGARCGLAPVQRQQHGATRGKFADENVSFGTPATPGDEAAAGRDTSPSAPPRKANSLGVRPGGKGGSGLLDMSAPSALVAVDPPLQKGQLFLG